MSHTRHDVVVTFLFASFKKKFQLVHVIKLCHVIIILRLLSLVFFFFIRKQPLRNKYNLELQLILIHYTAFFFFFFFLFSD